MKLSKKHTIGIAIGVALFLAAFGAAFAAVTLVQVSQTKEGNLSLTGTVIISGDNIALWDTQGRRPLTTPIQFTSVQTQAPLRSLSNINRPEVWIENLSSYNLRPIGPAQSIPIGGECCTWVDAQLWDQYGQWRGFTDWDSWPDGWVMAPNDMWLMRLYICCGKDDLPFGDYSFQMVFGAIGGNADALSAPGFSISEAEALSRGEAGTTRGPRP